MKVKVLKDTQGNVFTPKVSADSVYLSGSDTTLTKKLSSVDNTLNGKADNFTVSSSTPTASWGGTVTVGTVKGTDLKFKMPANPNTDTHYTAKNVVASSSTGTENVTSATSNPYINLVENGAVRSTHRISGSGATTVKTDANGNIVINSSNTTYGDATSSTDGLMSSADKAKLDGIAENANNYTHPAYTAKSSGLYKVTVDNKGHVSATTAVTKSDITALGIPGSDTNTHYTATPVLGASSATSNATSSTSDPYLNIVENGGKSGGVQIKGSGATTVNAVNGVVTISSTNTTYSAATQSANGLMSSTDKKKLDGIATGAEVNQNAFSNVAVGNVTVAADSKTDTLTLVAGSNVTITPDATNDKITIASSYVNTTYSAGTDLGLSGTTFNHANSGVTAGTYRSVTVNARGHVTAGTNPTTLSGYGITDAKIASGVITLGSNTITPLTSASTLAAGKVSGTLATGNIPDLDASKITSGTISVDRLPATALERCVVVADDTARFKLTTSSVQVGDTVKVTATKKMYMVIDSSKLSTEEGYEEYFTSTDWSTITGKPSSYTPSSHTHTKAQITDFPSSMPASDVYAWAKAKTKPSYAWSEITDKPSTFTPSSHTHTKSEITDFPASMPASDVYAWAKASTKPTYSWSEITSKPTTFTPASHTHNYAGSASAGGPADDFSVDVGSDNADRYVYFAYNNPTYNNSTASSVTKGKAVIDSEFKYNPTTNKLSTGSIQLNSKVTLQYNSSTESLDFIFA